MVDIERERHESLLIIRLCGIWYVVIPGLSNDVMKKTTLYLS